MGRLPIGGNLVYNGDFELAPPFTAAQTGTGYLDGTASGSAALSTHYGWHKVGSGTQSAMFDSTEKHSGNYSLKLSLAAAGSYLEARSNMCTTYNQAKGFVVQPNTTYTMTFWMKTANTAGTATNGAFGTVILSTAAGAAGTAVATTTAVKTNTDWTQYTLTFTTGATDRFGHFEARFYGHQGTGTLTGDAWFDDISMPAVVSRAAA